MGVLKLLDLPNELLNLIFSFQEPKEVALLVTCSKSFIERGKRSLSMQYYWWKLTMESKWKLSNILSPSDFKSNSFFTNFEMQDLYHQAQPMITGLLSDSNNVICNHDEKTAVFVGRVGVSNRSIQSSSPFPSVSQSTVLDIFTMLRKCLNKMLQTMSPPKGMLSSILQPHLFTSIPFQFYDEGNNLQYYLKPRAVHFFEVEIVKAVEPILSPVADNVLIPEGMTVTTTTGDCVAVGLATNSFQKKKRLPGWDEESYGFHGDDGAIFHGRGWQLREFGPTFGYRDVVGCGLDVMNRSIFFTLNGKFLGTAFTNVNVDKPLFPTVGIDANCAVSFNFGQTPFKFDFVRHLETC